MATMTKQEYDCLLSERQEAINILNTLPPEHVIDRLSMEEKIASCDREIKNAVVVPG